MARTLRSVDVADPYASVPMFPAQQPRKASEPSEPSEPGVGGGRHSESVARPITAGRKVLALDLPPPGDLPVALGDRIGGRYVVDRLLASGGMGVVCLGTHTELRQRVAIKFMRETFAASDSLVQRFLNEARAAATLKSEHVVRVMDVGQLDTGVPYLVMEHLEGRDLEAVLVQDGPIAVTRALGWVLEVCDALAEAHASGIIHRDIKPENLFLATQGTGREIVKVVDFGLAKRLNPEQVAVTGPQDSMGSPCYMSPEQISMPHQVDERTDVWSLGVVLYRLLTGVLPFDGSTVLEVYARVLNAPQKPMHVVRPELDPTLDVIMNGCLEKDPARRIGSIVELSAELNSYLAGLTSSLVPVVEAPPAEPAVVVPRRQRGGLLAAVALASVLCGFVIGHDPDTRTEARARLRAWIEDARQRTSGPLAAMLDDARVSLAPQTTPDEPVITRLYDPPLNPALGVTSRWPARGRHRERLLAAEKERDMTTLAPAKDQGDSWGGGSISTEHRQEDYGAFSEREAPTPIAEAPPPTAAPPAPSPPPPPLVNPSERRDEPSRNDLKPP